MRARHSLSPYADFWMVSIRSSRGALGRLRSSATECKSRSHGFTEYLLWMQTTGATPLAVKQHSLFRMSLSAKDGRSASNDSLSWPLNAGFGLSTPHAPDVCAVDAWHSGTDHRLTNTEKFRATAKVPSDRYPSAFQDEG